jgi:ribosome-binding factor A
MSIRTERIARLLQRELADILNNDLGLASGPLTTVTHVRVTRDLSIAYVHLSVMAESAGERNAAFSHVSDRTSQIRLQLAGRIRHQIRAVPELRFFLDETEIEAAKIDSLLEKIRTERESRGDASIDLQDDANEA